jgi:hypothetical protein
LQRSYGGGGGGRGGNDRLAGRLRDNSGHDPRNGSYGSNNNSNRNRNQSRQIDYREFQRCFVEPDTGVVVFKYRGGHLVRITPEGEITLNTHGYHNVSLII